MHRKIRISILRPPIVSLRNARHPGLTRITGIRRNLVQFLDDVPDERIAGTRETRQPYDYRLSHCLPYAITSLPTPASVADAGISPARVRLPVTHQIRAAVPEVTDALM